MTPPLHSQDSERTGWSWFSHLTRNSDTISCLVANGGAEGGGCALASWGATLNCAAGQSEPKAQAGPRLPASSSVR